MENQYTFENVRHALIWATETKRRETRPSISNIYDKGLYAELKDAEENKEWTGWRAHLPNNKEEKFMLAAKVWQAVKSLPKEQQDIVHLSFFGDWYSDAHLKKMLAFQDASRKQGKLIRLSHRYSVRQVATLLNMNYRTVHRKLDVAFLEIEKELNNKGLVEYLNVFNKVG